MQNPHVLHIFTETDNILQVNIHKGRFKITYAVPDDFGRNKTCGQKHHLAARSANVWTLHCGTDYSASSRRLLVVVVVIY